MEKINDKYLTIVNKEIVYDDDFFDKNFEFLSVDTVFDGKSELEAKTYAAFLSLKEGLEKEGLTIDLNSARRSVEEQKSYRDQRLSEAIIEDNENLKNGTYDRTNTEVQKVVKSVAEAGHSEHHTGLAIDVYVHKVWPRIIQKTVEIFPTYRKVIKKMEQKFKKDELEERFDKLHKMMVDYGFIYRYPADKKDITGFDKEPWHLRYVGEENAKRITNSGLCLEEYVKMLEQSSGSPSDDNQSFEK